MEAMRLFRVEFDFVWSDDEDKQALSLYGPEGEYNVLAKDAEEAIKKVKDKAIGTKSDPDENGAVAEVLAIIVRKVELRCDIDIC